MFKFFKYSLIVIAAIILLAILNPMVSYFIKSHKNYDIDLSAKREVISLYEKYGAHGPGIMSLDMYKPLPITWNNKLIRYNSKIYTTVENGYTRGHSSTWLEESIDDGKTWIIIPNTDKAPCYYTLAWDDNLVCISGDTIAFLNDNGELIKERQFVNIKSAQHDLAIYQVRNEIVMVWSDERARWPNFFHYVPTPYSGDTFSGPYLLMAGKLNLDTLDFKEYVIGYNASKLEDIGITPK